MADFVRTVPQLDLHADSNKAERETKFWNTSLIAMKSTVERD